MGGAVFPPCYLPCANYGGGDEDNGDLLQKIPCMCWYTQCPQPCSRPPPTHASAGDSWTLTGKSGSVSCGVTAPSSGILVHTRFCLCPLRAYFTVLCKFGQLYGGVNSYLLQEHLCHDQVCCTQGPCPCGSPLLTHTSQEMLKHSSVSVSVGSLGPGVCKVFLSPLSISNWYGVWSKHKFAHLTILLGLLLCPLGWGISSQSLQHLTSYWGFSELEREIFPHSWIWRSSIQWAKIRPGDDCGSDHELLIVKFRLNWRKYGKPLDHSGMAQIKSLMIIQWKWEIYLRD